jgi:lambda family phage minor tail protein L
MPTKAEVYYQITGGAASINAELGSLQPSTPVHLYEIDLQSVYPSILTVNIEGQPIQDGILRIYNDYNLFNIVSDPNGRALWRNEYYYPFPIHAEGFDLTTLGARPTPKLYIANNSPDKSNNSFYKYLRMQIRSLGDLAGCKFTRIKTFLKYLHGNNFTGNINPYTNDTSIYEVELPKDIYYIDRKSSENSQNIEFSLVSVLDIENLTLPNRTILAKRCPYSYRGEGCLYEYNKRATYIHSGVYGSVVNSDVKITLPLEAPPVSTENDEKFLGDIFSGNSPEAFRFTGINYFRTGVNNNYSEWSFSNFTLGGAGTAVAAATILSDNSASTVGITSQAASGIVTLSLIAPAEITRVRLATNNTIRNNFQFEYSQDGTRWYNVPNISGLNSFWNLSGLGAGTYDMDFSSKGLNKYWRLSTLNNFAGTPITELNFSGQYRIGDSGLWITGYHYKPGEFTYFEKNGVKYYYFCIKNNTGSLETNLFNREYWQADSCSKSITACRNRWFKNPALRPVIWPMARNGWDWDRAVYHYDTYWGEYGSTVIAGKPTTSFTGLAIGNGPDFKQPLFGPPPSFHQPNGKGLMFNERGYHRDAYTANYRIGEIVIDPVRNIPYFTNPTEARNDCWPRRPDAIDPKASFACGIPKDASGNYLNGFLPYGGFPGTNPKG